MRNPHAGEPFTTSDEEIAAALEDVSIPTLMLSLVHMSGNPELIRGRLKPAGLFLNEVQGYMSEEDKAEARALALEVIRDYRDRGCPEPEPVSAELLHEMMDWLVCEEVPDEYVPMLIEEMELDGSDARRVGVQADAEARQAFPVVVIGCGQSGLLAGIRLKEAGIPFTIVEKNAGRRRHLVGEHLPRGTGRRRQPLLLLQLRAERRLDGVLRPAARAPGLLRGGDAQARHRAARPMGDRGAGGAVGRGRRHLGGAGPRQRRSRVGPDRPGGHLRRGPAQPTAHSRDPGPGDFRGPAFHSARWDHSTDISSKRVAMIGAGASGFQIAPTIAPEVEHLTVFQRTAQWMFPNPNYHASVGPGVRWALRHLPFYGRWYRFLIFWPGCDKGLEGARVDPDYPDQQRAVSERNEITRQMFTDWITSQVGDDPELLAKVIPDYPATGKRTLQDNGSWLRTLTRDNVELVRTGIDHIEADAIVTVDGERYPADVIVYATGFHANQVLWPMEITGRDGVELRALWGERPAAYLGITVPGFPNFFCMYGPGTNLAHGGSLIFHSECQMRYITQCLEALIAGGHRSMEPRQERYDDWHERTQREIKTLVWAQPSVKHSFFKNAYGEIHVLSPWRLVDYWSWTREPDLDDFVLR